MSQALRSALLQALRQCEHQSWSTGRVPIFCDRREWYDSSRKVKLSACGQIEGLADAFQKPRQVNRLEATAHDLDGRGTQCSAGQLNDFAARFSNLHEANGVRVFNSFGDRDN